MMRRYTCVSYVGLATGLIACAPDIHLDPGERDQPPLVEFDPAHRIIPFPNNLLLNKDTQRIEIPIPCVESSILKDIRLALDQLDGFGNYRTGLRFSVSKEPDEQSLRDRIFVYCRRVRVGGLDEDVDPTKAPNPADPTAPKFQTFELSVGETTRFDSDCDGFAATYQVLIIPQDPLGEQSICGAALVNDPNGPPVTKEGAPFTVSPTWYLTRQQANPLLSAEALGSSDIPGEFQDLWEDHQPILDFMAQAIAVERYGPGATPLDRSDFLLAWEFTTQSVSLPFDSTASPSGPMARLGDTPDGAVVNLTLTDPNDIRDRFNDEIGDGFVATHPCDEMPCSTIGSIVVGTYQSPNYVGLRDNPGDLPNKAWGPWSDPLLPARSSDDTAGETVVFEAFFPNGSGPWPVVIFEPGTGGGRDALYYLAPLLTEQGIASITIDWMNQGGRAPRIDESVETGCDGTRTYKDDPQCFDYMFGARLDVSRDALRQTMFDIFKLIRVLKYLDAQNSSIMPLVDSSHIGYVGQSQGGIEGAIMAAWSPDISAAVLNVTGIGWSDILVDADDTSKRCRVVDAMIAAGLLQGQASQGGTNPGALCFTDTTNAWRKDPRVQVFKTVIQWLIDPADPANFLDRLSSKIQNNSLPILLQEVIDDEAVPNKTTEAMGRVLKIDPDGDGQYYYEPAAIPTTAIPPPSPTSAAISGDTRWIGYHNTPNETFSHTSIYYWTTADEKLASAQIRSDALRFLVCQLISKPAGQLPCQ